MNFLFLIYNFVESLKNIVRYAPCSTCTSAMPNTSQSFVCYAYSTVYCG